MTPTLVWWLKIFIIGLMLHSIWGIVRSARNNHQLLPSSRKEWTKLFTELVYLCIALFLFFMVQRNFQQPLSAVLKYEGKELSQLKFNNLTEHRADELANYKGKTIILNVWATWCGPCRRELPDLNTLKADSKNKEFVVIALSDEADGTVEKFIQTVPRNIIYGTYRSHALLDSIGTRPISILIDKEGHVKNVVAGARGYSFFNDWVKD